MPLARIDLMRGKSAEYRQAVGDVVYRAMVEILNAPQNDRFQVIAEHDESNLIYDPTFFGFNRSKDVIFVQLTLADGRTLEQKRKFYKRVVDDLHDRLCAASSSCAAR